MSMPEASFPLATLAPQIMMIPIPRPPCSKIRTFSPPQGSSSLLCSQDALGHLDQWGHRVGGEHLLLLHLSQPSLSELPI